MYTKRIINKIPGDIPAESKKEKQGYIGDLSQKTIPQLNDLLQRQLKILSNRVFISNLADKGEKIRKLKEAIEEELKGRDESERLSGMLAAMSVNGKEDMDALEWTGNCAPGHAARTDDTNLSDDDDDPLKILATHSGAGFHKKKHKVIKPEEPLINPSDLEPEGEVLEEYAKHLCEKMDSVKPVDPKAKTKFLPFKTLSHSRPGCKQEVDRGRRWEVTAATPPPPIHGDAKLVSLQESIKLQCEQQQKLKEIQTKHAAERLATTQDYSVGRLPLSAGGYRDTLPPPSPPSSGDELSDQEVHDDEYPDGGGVVIYNLVDDIIQ
uniref:Uncharacterized protein n=2 Tax=Graphocephala atropunctata TaxID=36148 RepID=A0A1B6LRU8_9HEMI